MTPSERHKIGMALFVIPLFLVVMGFAMGGLVAIPDQNGVRLGIRDRDGTIRCSVTLSTDHLPGVVVYSDEGNPSWGFPR